MIRPPTRRRIVRRLLAANGLVIAAGAVTLAVVAVLVSPPLFHLHISRALGPISQPVAGHLDRALSTALLVSLGLAVLAAAAAALAVSWVLSRRLARPIEELSHIAGRLAGGDLTARADPSPVDDELADLTAAFNTMAVSLQHTEDARRRLLSDVAHELRTPLSTIEGYLEGLADGVVQPDDDTWTTLRHASGRLRRLVDDIGLLSRLDEGRLTMQRRPVRPDVLVADAVRAAADADPRTDLVIRSDVPSHLPTVAVDADRIHQVLANLLDNARRHTPAGGTVSVTAGRNDGAVVIRVADTGRGISSDELPHLFERFYRGDAARRAGAGSGIGLTIARAIARAHHGDLTADSDGPGRGATFTLTLPGGPAHP